MRRYAADFAPSSRVSFSLFKPGGNHNLCDDIILLHDNPNMLSTCRTAGRYATPAALYLLSHTCLNCFFELFEPLLCEADLREPSLSLRGTRGPQNAFIRSPSATAVTPPPWLARPLPASLRDTPPNLAPARPS